MTDTSTESAIESESTTPHQLPDQLEAPARFDLPAQFDLPASTFGIIAMWGVLESIALIALGSPLTAGGNVRTEAGLMAVVFGGICAAHLMVATWWLVGARPVASESLTDAVCWMIERDRRFRIALLLGSLVQVGLLFSSSEIAVGLVGLLLSTVTLGSLGPILYRQMTARRIAKNKPQQRAAFDIRGLMTVTFAIALAASLASKLLPQDSGALRVTFSSGFLLAPVWLSLVCWMLNVRRRTLWWSASILSSLILVSVTMVMGLQDPSLDEDQVTLFFPMFLSLYIHGIVFLGVARTEGFRLSSKDPN